MKLTTRLKVPAHAGLALLLVWGAVMGHAQIVTSPEKHLGRPLGTDFQLADWTEVSSWYWRLAEESPRVRTERLGTTSEGRDFLLSVISSRANLDNLDAIKRYASILADPRGHPESAQREAIECGKVVLFISPQMHSTEAGGTEAVMKLAHALATSDEEPWASARENVVVGLFPCTNPDGLDHVVSWYRKHVGTPFEASGMLRLYQQYTGHDNNRDWFLLTQAETRLVTEQLYRVWRPQVYWDLHQQASDRERLFVPPYRDPLNPNLDPAIITGIDVLGSRILHDLTRAGLTGVSTGVTYDMWWTGGNRNVPVRHNIIGLLSEAASVNIATPVFLPRTRLLAPRGLDGYRPSNRFPAPWPGGWWRLRDIIEYQFAFGQSLLGSLAREPEFWLRNALEASQRTIATGNATGPRAWIIPSDNRDPDAVRRLADVLLSGGIELHVAPDAIAADGRTYPAGSIVILRSQPYSNHVKDLFEVQRYPAGEPPYDVAGWTLTHLLGVRRVEVMQPIDAAVLRPVCCAAEAINAFAGDPRTAKRPDVVSGAHSRSWSRVVEQLENQRTVHWITAGDDAGLFQLSPPDVEPEQPALALESLPRVGLYSPWFGNIDEGWTRWVFDTWKIPYQTVRNEQLRAGQLLDFIDVLILPDMTSRQLDEGREEGTIPDEYAWGLAPEGAMAVEEFVRQGGTLIASGNSSRWAIELFRVPLIDVTREPAHREFSCPGSVLRSVPARGHAYTAGLPDSLPLFFSRSSAWRELTEAEWKQSHLERLRMRHLLHYAPTRVLLSGWIEQPEVIAGRSAWVEVAHGHGRLHLFAFRPLYRAWSQATFPLLFRSLLLCPQGSG